MVVITSAIKVIPFCFLKFKFFTFFLPFLFVYFCFFFFCISIFLNNMHIYISLIRSFTILYSLFNVHIIFQIEIFFGFIVLILLVFVKGFFEIFRHIFCQQNFHCQCNNFLIKSVVIFSFYIFAFIYFTIYFCFRQLSY